MLPFMQTLHCAPAPVGVIEGRRADVSLRRRATGQQVPLPLAAVSPTPASDRCRIHAQPALAGARNQAHAGHGAAVRRVGGLRRLCQEDRHHERSMLGRVWTSSVLRTLGASRGVEPVARRGLQGQSRRGIFEAKDAEPQARHSSRSRRCTRSRSKSENASSRARPNGCTG